MSINRFAKSVGIGLGFLCLTVDECHGNIFYYARIPQDEVETKRLLKPMYSQFRLHSRQLSADGAHFGSLPNLTEITFNLFSRKVDQVSSSLESKLFYF
jgi:hypothetical protein